MSKTLKIAFSNGGIVPASVLGKKKGEDKRVGPHEPVEVPADYGASLIADRFAYAWDAKTAPKPPVDPAKAAEDKAKSIIADAEKKAGEIEVAAEDKARSIIADAEDKAAEIVAAAGAKPTAGGTDGADQAGQG